MTAGWSWFVIALVVVNVAGCVWLLWRTSGSNNTQKSPDSTSHIWDGDLTEYDKPLPRWWINLFYLTILFSIGYLIWFPGLGSFKGMGGWTSRQQHATAQAEADAQLAATLRPYHGVAIDVLARNPQAVQLGRSIFSANCAQCHGSSGKGAIGYPDLTDSSWQWGGDPATVLQTVLEGRMAQMPVWKDTLESMGGVYAVDDVTTYVLSLTDRSLLDTNGDAAARGRQLFMNICSACHGPDAHGNPQLGAPDLTDDYWLYGRSRAAIREALRHGRNGTMPAHRPLLGEDRARLAAAYVWSLSHPAAGP